MRVLLQLIIPQVVNKQYRIGTRYVQACNRIDLFCAWSRNLFNSEQSWMVINYYSFQHFLLWDRHVQNKVHLFVYQCSASESTIDIHSPYADISFRNTINVIWDVFNLEMASLRNFVHSVIIFSAMPLSTLCTKHFLKVVFKRGDWHSPIENLYRWCWSMLRFNIEDKN